MVGALLALGSFSVAQERSFPISLDSNETLFSVLTALNSCGYDQDLDISDATRNKVRDEVQKVLRQSEEAEAARTALCEFYQGHTPDRNTNRSLSPYISLALYMDGPPHFAPRIKEEDLPPDAYSIAAFGTELEHFYDKVGFIPSGSGIATTTRLPSTVITNHWQRWFSTRKSI